MSDGEGLRVLAVTNTYPTEASPGDTPCIKEQLAAMMARGVQVELLHVGRALGKQTYFTGTLQLLAAGLQKSRYDLVHAYYGHSGLMARMQGRYPLVVTFLGSDLLSRKKDSLIGRTVARLADGIIVMSEEMKRVSGRGDAHVIPFGVNTEVFRPRSMQDARRELGLSPGEKLVLFPWNPARTVKRLDLVKEAMGLVKKERGDARLMVVHDKPHPVMAKYMNACDVMVLASNHEGAPMAVREAMACNLPIVSVDVGDVRRVVGDTEGCYICKRTPADIAEKLLLALERGKRTDGAQVVARMMDVGSAAGRVISVYRQVLNGRVKGDGL